MRDQNPISLFYHLTLLLIISHHAELHRTKTNNPTCLSSLLHIFSDSLALRNIKVPSEPSSNLWGFLIGDLFWSCRGRKTFVASSNRSNRTWTSWFLKIKFLAASVWGKTPNYHPQCIFLGVYHMKIAFSILYMN